MLGRRRFNRFSVTDALRGSLRILDSATLEHFAGNELHVLTDFAADLNDRLSLDRLGASPLLSLSLRVADTDVVMVDGAPRHRLRLEIMNDSTPLEEKQLIGLLVREIPTSLIEISRDGCLLSTASAVEEGAVAELSLTVGQRTCRDEVRIVRCLSDDGHRNQYHVAAEFTANHSQTHSIKRQPGLSWSDRPTTQLGLKETRS
jgi:hypothetical protein